MAFPPQVGAGCVSGREGLTKTRVLGLTETLAASASLLPNMRLRRVARLNGKKNTGVQT